ncbi:MAG: ATP-dependent nuclease, partial [Flavobacteriales bacterium]
ISPLKSEANRLARQAEDEINQRFGELQETIKSVARSVTGIKAKMFFEVSEKVSDIMVTKENSDQEIHVDNQGEGLKRQIWFSLIKAKADENEGGPNMFIWAFDEPETHLHPSAQREFFDALKSLAKGNVQVLLGTHSTVFIDKSNLENISSISQDSSGYTMNSTCTSIEDVYGSLKLKNSDFLFYDKFLAIEGETEEHLIPRLYKLYKGRSLVDDNIQLIKMKGKSNWYETKLLLERLMNQFRKPVNSTYYLFDNDATRAIGAANKTDRMFFVGKQDIEDALTNEVWIRALNMYYDQEMTFDVDWLQEQRDKVLQGQDCPANKKMVRIIEDAIRKKWIDEGNEANTHKFLPKKADSADFLMSGINDLNDIPQVIRDCFDKL